MTPPVPDGLRQRLADLLDTHLEQLQRAHVRLLASAAGPRDEVEEILVTTAIMAQQFAKDALSLLGDDFDSAAGVALREVPDDPAADPLLPADPEARAALRADAAALLAAVWVVGELTALVPPSAWPEDLPATCLATVARSRIQHEINDDLERLDRPDDDEDDFP
ncbi:hypothetical protein LX15_005332 [Streptoalloteichus tenebrarius]|uniref:Uncharacterized protein n=1 Tax=Streptoalloteichus tenebrarius (strain ATCC 17920 / DSM 40477 / JCM 4838 / CBS 697.72 / NBRC 16177 / NCIMB 11028 / NRRL B-12390 / A12253. 1 / ISP 5477) TaxID=1933 RepID=A0ABT1I1D8_STRSD|nr:hypothetical protein [Streptoalloteichus tenebrarius]MCP2261606.1 hypothetical protein [Streptoalloteichus tenebrarius]BFE99392.1 hypothetical protein GCM10020241_10680 [Streptoalloteichus tenebrarius]